jgi:hypothetical protein
MSGIEKVMTPRGRRTTMDEDRGKLIDCFCTIFPYRLEFVLQNIDASAEAPNFRADPHLLLVQLLKEFIVDAWYSLLLQLC